VKTFPIADFQLPIEKRPSNLIGFAGHEMEIVCK